jgi:hypothetical protein
MFLCFTRNYHQCVCISYYGFLVDPYEIDSDGNTIFHKVCKTQKINLIYLFMNIYGDSEINK